MKSVIQTNEGRPGGAVGEGQSLDCAFVEAADFRGLSRRVFIQCALGKRFQTAGVAGKVVVVDQIVAQQNVGNSQGQSCVGSGPNGQPLVGPLGCTALERIDGNNPGATALGFQHAYPQMAVGDGGVGSPVDE